MGPSAGTADVTGWLLLKENSSAPKTKQKNRMESTVMLLAVLLLHLLAIFNHCDGINWLGLHRVENVDPQQPGGLPRLCQTMHRQALLNRAQLRFCRRQAASAATAAGAQPSRSRSETLAVLIDAARATLAVCQSQFRYFRWNCSSLQRLPQVSEELQSLTAEQAMVRALSGFVLTATLAAECARGRISSCPCGSGGDVSRPSWLDRVRQTSSAAASGRLAFKLEGCQANLKMGTKLAKRFLSLGQQKKRKSTDPAAAASLSNDDAAYQGFAELIGRHNYLVGVQAVRHADAVRCKCHGTSAACTVRTCHRVLHYGVPTAAATTAEAALPHGLIQASEENPLDVLMRMYDTQRMRKAIFDETGYAGYEESCPDTKGPEGHRLDNPLSVKPACFGHRIVAGLPKKDVLLFHDHSLDYCSVTHGRECLPDDSQDGRILRSGEPSGNKRREALCSVMCCGRGHIVRSVTYPGTHPECKTKTCRLLQRPFRVICDPCTVSKAFCS